MNTLRRTLALLWARARQLTYPPEFRIELWDRLTEDDLQRATDVSTALPAAAPIVSPPKPEDVPVPPLAGRTVPPANAPDAEEPIPPSGDSGGEAEATEADAPSEPDPDREILDALAPELPAAPPPADDSPYPPAEGTDDALPHDWAEPPEDASTGEDVQPDPAEDGQDAEDTTTSNESSSPPTKRATRTKKRAAKGTGASGTTRKPTRKRKRKADALAAATEESEEAE